MEYRRLGRTDIDVSIICLGTMTWGQQNTEAEAHAQMDAAWNAGVNFMDAAEMYPVPPAAETQGLTETYIGTWLAARKNRDKVILATKVIGGSTNFPYLRDGRNRLDRRNIERALEASLGRLRTDYVDLYQLHWPDRTTNLFGRRGYHHIPDETPVPIEETLAVLQDLIKAGKVRHIGLSNEVPWGAMTFLHKADTLGLPRVASIQNPYNLLNRTYEIGLAEVSLREDCGLLAYSPLAGGVLTGKYLDGARPEGSRMTAFGQRFTRYSTPGAGPATRRYVELAGGHGLDPAQMAIAFTLRQPFLTSTIIGATGMEQLQTDLGGTNLDLPQDVIDGIEEIQTEIPDPCP